VPSPFPGMDPYLEGPLWTTLYFTLSSEIVRQLAPRLQPRYLVLPVERFIVEMAEGMAITTGDIYPDAGIVRGQTSAATAQEVATLEAPLQVATVIPSSIPHVSIEIRDRANRQRVTAIEVLSPTNKRGEGRLEYLAKRRRILLSTAHLLEIDLLRRGQRVPMQAALPPAPYFVFLSRAERRPFTDIWPVYLDQPLTIVPVPLLPEDADVPLDLQQCFTATYDLLGYGLAIDYTQPPDVPLPDSVVTWAEDRLRQAGLRR